MNWMPPNQDNKQTVAALIIMGLVLLAYSNSFQATWHMDDYPNILHNEAIQLRELSSASMIKAVGVDRRVGNNLPRPVGNLTLALNWYLHGTNPAGYHLVNLIIHLFNALLLFQIIRQLSLLADAPAMGRTHRHVLTAGAVLLWALNPVQTQAVTYVVQRYALLATLFGLAALFCYIRGRLGRTSLKRVYWWTAAWACFLLALGSKENAILWPVSILLVEYIFLARRDGQPCRRHATGVLIGAGLVVVVGGGFLALYDIDVWGYIRRGYETRPFSLFERVLTQPRVLLFYLSQLFYPIPQRLSLEHDLAVSTSLLNPWSTLPAILVVAGLVGFAVVRVRKQPMASLAILFFFTNHLVESSILPLEMVFEHRNYLPSLFLFWPLVGAAFHFKPGLRPSNGSRVKVLPAVMMGMVLLFGLGTFVRNMDWQTERRLWMDAYRKAPGSARAAVNLAIDLARAGEYQTAMALYRRSLTLSAPRKNHFRIMALSNMGNLEFMFGRYAAAVGLFEEALALEPGNLRSRYNLATAYTERGEFAKAEEIAKGLVAQFPDVSRYANLGAFIALKTNHPEGALAILRPLSHRQAWQRDTLLNTGVALSMAGDHERADWFFRQALGVSPNDPMILLCCLENSMRAGRTRASIQLARFITGRFPASHLAVLLADPVNELEDPARIRSALQRATQGREHDSQALDARARHASLRYGWMRQVPTPGRGSS